jgi:hypothetical protein
MLLEAPFTFMIINKRNNKQFKIQLLNSQDKRLHEGSKESEKEKLFWKYN